MITGEEKLKADLPTSNPKYFHYNLLYSVIVHIILKYTIEAQ